MRLREIAVRCPRDAGHAESFFRASADDGQRSEAFTKWLAAQPAKRVATVSHWGTMNNLLNRHDCIEASGLERRPTKASWGAAWPATMARLEVANCECIATVAQLEAACAS